MGDIDIERARALCDAATEGPWIAEYSGEQGNCVIPHDATSTREAVCVTRLYHQHADAEFIAAARTLVPALLDALAAAEVRTRELEATRQRVGNARRSTAIYRPDPATHGSKAWDEIECVSFDVIDAALRGSDDHVTVRRGPGKPRVYTEADHQAWSDV